MSKRLQVLIDEAEPKELRRIARQQHVAVAEWVRTTLRAAVLREPVAGPDRKLASIRAAARHAYPTADIDEMLAEIEAGRRSGAAG
jgi:hypothetical protein